MGIDSYFIPLYVCIPVSLFQTWSLLPYFYIYRLGGWFNNNYQNKNHV